MRRVLFWATTGLLLAGAAYLLMLTQRAVPPETVQVQRKPIEETLEARGRTSLRQTFVVTAPLSGVFVPEPHREGERVHDGAPLGEIDRLRYELEREVAQAELQRVEAALAETRDTAPEELLVSQAERTVESLDHTVEAAEAQTDSARSRFAYQRDYLQRIQNLFERQAASEDELHRAQVDATDAQVELRQAEVIERALTSLRDAVALLPPTIQRLIDRRLLHLRVLEAERLAARKRLELAELNLRRSKVAAPVSGVLLEFPIKTARTVVAGQVVAVLGRPGDLEARVDVLSSDAVQLTPGTRARLAWRAGMEPFGTAVVDRVEPEAFTKRSALGVEQQRVWVHLRYDAATLEQLTKLPAALPVGYELWVTFILRRHDNSLVVPRTAAYQDVDGRWKVQVVVGGEVRERTIRVGIVTAREVEVLDGLTESDRVVRVPEL